MQRVSRSPGETKRIAEIYLRKILTSTNHPGARVVGLSGELGAGKTTFIQAVAKQLGIKSKVGSPTFVIMKRYPIRKRGRHKFLFHLDAYRLKNERELLHLGWEKIITNGEHLVFIEWPENVSKVMPKHAKVVKISHGEKGQRYFKIK